ncbi:MAG: hypothetical protein JSS78_06620 [Bacteroidetes bacterium]|nr:hypothetical protein [Bacteroidota bacterium]
MRKTLFLILALPFLVMQSCQKNDQQPLQPTKSNQMIYSRISSADEVFADMEEVLD